MTKGKVVLVPFPFDDLSTLKVRPALCLTEPTGPSKHVVVAFITRQIHPKLSATDILLDPSQADFASTGLKLTSTVKLHRLITVTTALIRRELGKLSSAQQKIVVRISFRGELEVDNGIDGNRNLAESDTGFTR